MASVYAQYILTDGEGYALPLDNDAEAPVILNAEEVAGMLKETPSLLVYRLTPAEHEFTMSEAFEGA